MQHCTLCGLEFPDNARFCGRCGYPPNSTTGGPTYESGPPRMNEQLQRPHTPNALGDPSSSVSEREEEERRRHGMPPFLPFPGASTGWSQPNVPMVQGIPQASGTPFVQGTSQMSSFPAANSAGASVPPSAAPQASSWQPQTPFPHAGSQLHPIHPPVQHGGSGQPPTHQLHPSHPGNQANKLRTPRSSGSAAKWVIGSAAKRLIVVLISIAVVAGSAGVFVLLGHGSLPGIGGGTNKTPGASVNNQPSPSPHRGQWRAVASPGVPGKNNSLSSVTAVSANDVWAVGDSSTSMTDQTLIEHWNGTNWSIVPSPDVPGTENSLVSVTAVSANDIWAVGATTSAGMGNYTLIEHWNGTNWSIVPSPDVPGVSASVNEIWNYLNSATAVSANDIWAVGESYVYSTSNGTTTVDAAQTLIEHWNGTYWSIVPGVNASGKKNRLFNATAVSANDIWALGVSFVSLGAGQTTLIEHWNGTNWSIVPSPGVPGNYNSLGGISAVSANDVWAIDISRVASPSQYQTLIEHWNGTNWSVVSSPIPGSLGDIVAISVSDVWAVGGGNSNQTLIEHYSS